MTRLTLSADEKIVAMARKQANADGTSISAMFANIVKARAAQKKRKRPLSPLAKEASGMLRAPSGFDEKEEIAQSLAKKYGVNP